MTFELKDLILPVGAGIEALARAVAEQAGQSVESVHNLRTVRRAIDARKKPHVKWVITVRFDLDLPPGEAASLLASGKLQQVAEPVPICISAVTRPSPVLVVGMGPCGLFAAWQLARHGIPVTLLERGRPVEERVADVRRFWSTGLLDPDSNVQFGEGGAGTFSDGKLTTRLKHPDIRLILETLVDCGAPESILVDAKPHVGTDRLRLVLLRFRQRLLDLGVVVRYRTRLTGLRVDAGKVRGGLLADGEELRCSALILAPGHSARDTYRMLAREGVALAPKGFAVGVRVEHPVELIDEIQYGQRRRHPTLPPADYRLAWNDPASGRGVYSFCMCPGGEVVNASSEPGRLTVNGMSSYARASGRSNSALVVTVDQRDFGHSGALGGVLFQEEFEARAFAAGGGDFRAPAESLLHFLHGKRGTLVSSCRPGVREARLAELLPPSVTDGLRLALPQFDRRMRGFISGEAVLVGVESRTSAPLRIERDSDGESPSHPGLFPAGEGAGYAGGIMSAALDGLRVAETIIRRQNGE